MLAVDPALDPNPLELAAEAPGDAAVGVCGEPPSVVVANRVLLTP
jgi:hypothetical protein